MEKHLRTHLITGAILIGVGVLFILDNFNVIRVIRVWQFWPFILVAIGIPRLMQYPSPKAFCDGIWLVSIGLWLYISIERTFGFSFSRTWPLLLIVAGACMVIKNVLQSSNRQRIEGSYGE